MDKKQVRVGVMGYSGQKFDINKANESLKSAFDIIEDMFPESEIIVVSGYTNLGVPALAYAEAVKRGWKTAGVACNQAKEYPVFPCDEVTLVGENWGDESPTFLKTSDLFVRVGGGGQSKRETAAAIAAGKTVYEYELEALPS